MTEIHQKYLTGERALFQGHDLRITDTIFADGESPLKESRNVDIADSMFKWRYPLWYSRSITVDNCTMFDGARAAVWYTDDIRIRNTVIEAPKTIRRCNDVTLEHVHFPDAVETVWHCKNVRMTDVTVKGEYFAMNSESMEIDRLTLTGKYSFDGVKNVTIRNSKLITKDAFWNSENVTVYDSVISGEYLGWNAKNLTLINCTVESLQGLCYVDNLVMKNCRLLNTTLAFEYSTVDADILGNIDSVFNPSAGRITADTIGELTVDPTKVDPSKTTIVCRKTSEK